ncbi:DEAD/DEAH box helicase [Aneurinibacillus terranovensis]|uniref:DEAD/DEAH box helicase n=1 Tax=Aneurinibacillus terranovensis TaxID=278991 RepID=UPI000415A284|nr:DEAD/DEAH box helicase [Aneurinibacillus terranovensis]
MAIFAALAPNFQEALKKMNITRPTEIQEVALPLLLKGKSVIGESHTGTGKTLAYMLPLVERIDCSLDSLQAIIFAPTRELTLQIARVLDELCRETNIRYQTIIGGVDIKRQVEKLKLKPHIIVGSPGRMVDLLDKKKLKVHEVRMVVVDEADQMVEARMLRAMETVLARTPRDRQISVFSATVSSAVEEWSKQWAEQLETIKIKRAARLPDTVNHYFIVAPERLKFEELRRLLVALRPTRAIIFVKKLHQVTDIATWLSGRGVKIAGIHSKTNKLDREKAMRQIHEGSITCLVTTDLLARGLDVENVSHIINFDLPLNPEGYIHRVGRTGRAGKSGTAVTLLEPKEKFMAEKFGSQLGIIMEERVLDHGKLAAPRAGHSHNGSAQKTGVNGAASPFTSGRSAGKRGRKPAKHGDHQKK